MVIVFPMQIALLETPPKVATGLTVTVTNVKLIHPPASVPVTVYVVVTAGFAETLVPVVEDKPAAGLHI